MASFLHNLLLLLFLALLILISSASNTQTQTPIRPKKLVVPVQKDRATNLHVAQIFKRTPSLKVPVVIDINGKYLWVNCENQHWASSYNAPRCHSTQCSRANSNYCRTCSSKSGPGCHNNACGLMTMNPVTHQSAMGELAEDILSIQTTQGSSPGPMVTHPQFLFGCAPSVLLQKGLPRNVQGVAGLGHSPISLPYQLASHFGFPPRLAVCLTSSPGVNGVIFFGDGPYLLNPGVDVSRQLTYTPLTIGQQGEYYINVQSIKINNKVVPINNALLRPPSTTPRFGTAMISTTNPYTIVEHTIFRALSQLFINELSKVPQVGPVAPFGVCFNSNRLPYSKVGPAVPNIDLVLDPNRKVVWRISGANAMVQARPGVMCLGLLDGGLRPRSPIVIGSHQLEDNLIQLDLANSRLGFSSLLSRRTNCANFNFTSTP